MSGSPNDNMSRWTKHPHRGLGHGRLVVDGQYTQVFGQTATDVRCTSATAPPRLLLVTVRHPVVDLGLEALSVCRRSELGPNAPQ